jgi:signal transduction histidine kinase
VSGSEAIPTVTVQAAERGQTLLFTVSDNGPGLSASDRENVFSRFWRGDRSRARSQGGSGLGLAIAEAIIRNHGGRIWVEGNEGGGSTFLFALPFSRTPAAGDTSLT